MGGLDCACRQQEGGVCGAVRTVLGPQRTEAMHETEQAGVAGGVRSISFLCCSSRQQSCHPVQEDSRTPLFFLYWGTAEANTTDGCCVALGLCCIPAISGLSSGYLSFILCPCLILIRVETEQTGSQDAGLPSSLMSSVGRGAWLRAGALGIP